MKEKGEALQKDLNLLTENYAKDMNREFAKRSLPMEINYFGSLWRLKILEDIPYAELLFVMMREKGIHVWDGFPCFMTTAYKMEDIHTLKNTFISCVDELISAGILNSHQNDTVINHTESPIEALNKPPVQGARLGMDQLGNPAWFVEDSKEKGNFVKIEL
jgi:hypothetical protein